MSDTSCQRDGYARAVFDGKLEDGCGDFHPTEGPREAVIAALDSTSARVRMRAIMVMSVRGTACSSDIMRVASMKNDEGEYDFLAGQTYGPERFCPTVEHCVRLFLPVIMLASPSAVLDLLASVVSLPPDQVRQVMDVLAEGGAAAVAAALALADSVDPDALLQSKASLAGKIPDIPELLTLYLGNPSRCHTAVVDFLASRSPESLRQFLTALFDQDDRARPWLLEGLKHQTSRQLCRKLAERCGLGAVPKLIDGLASSDGRTRVACAYALSCVARDSSEARSALQSASQRESSWRARWQMRRYCRSMRR
jgi:hypothetical protein